MDLYHCFGATPAHQVDARQATDMLAASQCPYLAVNTHSIAGITRGDDLPVGYASATLGSVRARLGARSPVRPVLNINHPTTAREAVDRARRAVELTGIMVIKLEVLDDSLTVSRNEAVVDAAQTLVAEDGLEVWPLITPAAATFAACVAAGSSLVRVMGSPIGSRRGIDAERRAVLTELLAGATVPVMLDGGVGGAGDVLEAQRMGFSSVLVNSCLFTPGRDPVAVLRELRDAIDRVPVPSR
jgi:thiazole synthase